MYVVPNAGRWHLRQSLKKSLFSKNLNGMNVDRLFLLPKACKNYQICENSDISNSNPLIPSKCNCLQFASARLIYTTWFYWVIENYFLILQHENVGRMQSRETTFFPFCTRMVLLTLDIISHHIWIFSHFQNVLNTQLKICYSKLRRPEL